MQVSAVIQAAAVGPVKAVFVKAAFVKAAFVKAVPWQL
jgi:hypothetical protein